MTLCESVSKKKRISKASGQNVQFVLYATLILHPMPSPNKGHAKAKTFDSAGYIYFDILGEEQRLLKVQRGGREIRTARVTV